MTTQTKKVSVNGRAEERLWEVDRQAVLTVRNNEWLREFPQLLQRDLDEMQHEFPHWFLAAGQDMIPASCSSDHEFIVPSGGAMRCVKCGQTYIQPVNSLIWIGQFPVQITGADRVERRIDDLIDSRRLTVPFKEEETAEGLALFLYPTVKVKYPSNWDRSAPVAHYFYGFLESLGITVGSWHERTNHDLHMNSQEKICIFSSWNKMSICEVVQNRIIPHACAMVTIADGRRPERWFNR